MMDPQSQSFTPSFSATSNSNSTSNDTSRIQENVAKIQQVQTEHAERLSRLERRQDDDARMKSVWGNQSPFPSVLSGTPQHGPLQHPPSDRFADFDDDATNMMSSLHLDADNEPRRSMGAASRANSVRFDESANQNYVTHSSRPSMDLLSRTSSGLGGLQMNERTSSHKSEGRASSAHSMRSAASGRANSLNLDAAGYGLSDSGRSSLEPGLAPGLMLLGAVPAIIRCWMNTNFKHDALLYAAVCTGSYKSFLDLRLIQKLGFEAVIQNDQGYRTIELPVFFPEAVPHPSSSRSSSPAPQLPSLVVEFRVIERADSGENDKAIQIFLGSDVLRAHNADILFSSNSMTLYDNERNKLSIPLSRPENEAAFNTLLLTSGMYHHSISQQAEAPSRDSQNNPVSSAASVSSANISPPPGKYRPPGAIAARISSSDSTKAGSDAEPQTESRQSPLIRPSLTMLTTSSDRSDRQENAESQTASARNGSTPAIWSNWRNPSLSATATQPPAGLDWANAGKLRTDPLYQRKETGIKVLKPKTANRAFSTSATPTTPTPSTSVMSPADGSRSRFFDEGRRRSGPDTAGLAKSTAANTKENTGALISASSSAAAAAAPPKSKANPIGGASAFSWLNSGGSK